MKIGVLAVQGDVSEHIQAAKKAIDKLGISGEVISIKHRRELRDLNGMIIPGGESTVIGRLMVLSGLDTEIVDKAESGMAIFGSCAGMVLLAKKALDRVLGEVNQPLLKLMDIAVLRNAFGRQRESFEAKITVPKLGEVPFDAVFIRAPVVQELLSRAVEVLSYFDDKIVAVQQGNFLAVSFHPELSDDTRFHEYFIKSIKR